MPSVDGASIIATSKGPVSANGSNATFGENNVPLNDHMKDKTISIGWHWQYGWLRRPELDEVKLGYAYEEPDGDIVYVNMRQAKKKTMLACRRDADTGERYLCLHRK